MGRFVVKLESPLEGSPKPVENWNGVLSCARWRPKCMQLEKAKKQKPLPVVVFIHGGYYVSGHTSLYGPRYLMDEDVVLVTISYRVGALGFLNLGIKDARGNQGLKDQVLALKWIQENIHNFMGDKNLVTIMGQSAGGSSVHFHMLSKLSKGLFHRAVGHSGTILSPWAMSYAGKEQAVRLGRMLDCNQNDAQEMLACLLRKDVNKIVEAHSENLHFLHDPLSVFKPSIEEIDDDEAFLTEDPLKLMQTGNITARVPWINGVNSEEGKAVASVLVRDTTLLTEFQSDWRENFRKLLMYSTNDDSVPGKIRSYYFGSQATFGKQSNFANFTKLFSERQYFLGTHQSSLFHHSEEKESPVYLFYFAQPTPLSFGDVLWAQYGILPAFVEIGVFLMYHWIQRNVFGLFNPNKGVTHVDDLTFIFQICNIPEYSGDDGFHQLSKEMVRSWVTFARTGKPSPIFGAEWDPSLEREEHKKFQGMSSRVLNNNEGLSTSVHERTTVPKYLKIAIDSPKMIVEPFHDAMRFWPTLNLKEYRGDVM